MLSTGIVLTINEIVAAIVLEHQQTEECEVHDKDKHTAAILR